jgi:uncharacterized surface protein with fasciclin (FAS1) repeats
MRVLGRTIFMRLHSLRAAPAACTALAAGLALAAAACGSTTTTSATPTGGAGPVSVTPRPSPSGGSPAGTAARVGADCAMIPAKGKGSIGSMSTEQAVKAASTNPQLSVFTAAVRSSGLDKTLNTRRSYTLFIPANSAFAALSKTQIAQLHNAGKLRKIVSYQAVRAPISPQQFAAGSRPATLQGKPLTLSKSGSVYKVNDATVLCGNIKTSNANVYIVSKVLLPPG